jgi:cell division transport system permease protein
VRFRFLLNEIWTGLRRNVTMTIAMILTTAISIGLFGGALLVWRLADQSGKIYLSRVESQVFLNADVSQRDPDCKQNPCKALNDLLQSRDDVEHVVYLNPDEAYDDAIRRIPTFKNVASRAAFPASFKVKLVNPDDDEEFAQAMMAQPGVQRVLNQKDLVDRLFSVLYGLRDAAFGVAFVQAIGAILLIANMVQVSAFNRRTEIGIMRLVGASRWYTQLPFLLEAMLAALVGVVLAVIGLLVVRAFFLEDALKQFYDVPPPNPPLIARVDYLDILYITPVLLLGVVVAGVTAYVTLRLYVRR